LQPDAAKGYPGTARWLAPRSVSGHFHVRRGHRGDVAHLVRMLTGNAVCLVFGGGGSRGYAHIGVVRAFEELGIPIDAVGGTSIGAVIAAAAALGLGSEEMLTVCAPILARFLDPTLPLVSLMSGERALKGVASVAGPLDIEDLRVPFFCISTNLSRGGEVVHRTGSVALATRASGSVPGVFPPVPWDGDLLVDGGLSNNVPVQTMQSLFQGAIVAVDVIPETDLTASGELPNYLSGWTVAWRYMNPFKPRLGMPNLLSILMRSVTTASYSLRRATEAASHTALYLRPPVQRWNMLDFKEARPIAEQGYRATFQQIRRWWTESGPAILGQSGARARDRSADALQA
jgi:predicted acylesterase/phospholipase RssA